MMTMRLANYEIIKYGLNEKIAYFYRHWPKPENSDGPVVVI